MTTKELWRSRALYSQWMFTTFCSHIGTTKQKLRQKSYWLNRKKKEKQKEREVQEILRNTGGNPQTD